MQDLFAVILAAGKGTRMKSNKHKVLHQICGKPIIDHILDSLDKLGAAKTILVVGHLKESVQEHLGDRVIFAEQKEQLGTAHAVLQAKPILANKAGVTLVLNGDHPLFTVDTLAKLVEEHKRSGAAATVLTARLDDPTGYGRIVRRADGSVERIVEHKDASEEERQINEINTGTFCFDNEKLFSVIGLVNNDNAQGEYYLPDVLSILQEQGEKIAAKVMDDISEAMGVNDRVQLAQAEAVMRQRILRKHMLNGVTIVDPAHTYIDADVEIGPDTIIEPGTFLRGKTVIGSGCHIGPHSDLTDVAVADDTTVKYAVIDGSQIDEQAKIGPFTYIRPGSHIGAQTKIGCFVDVKKAQIGKGTKISHLAYVGDAEVGENVNIACGVITVNYNGVDKNRTIIQDGAFVGCNTNLIAPVTVEKGAYVAAGSTITKDVPENALAIARERQVNKLDYVPKLMKKIKKQNG
ncbi:bifunctional UDP-N-acetylglucosamine diphosphorylase/glucosamine-1-phosphate N-acetyltransferase GlmU [Thermoflavimicrobium dichotomicum]|uniref:Bifunctional protein GlmU n=1 Tax=Thermoflavimicrobium dichotomicum TaxID=46223 RepID=A0A1I3QQM5_9BACL|nr:bifunctional UDP-N-acetylglucosamine diphosphorylase/glucosamine-1-phosphate N-acetyltransferase GlmU [Thermoflavimicrobium dichotomicum]SFJ35437.1 bifunctional UDP-N-acetylglucosamine pyrophosphorylase / Glucosamine-1-phosphate N-acetyltransferase [Thermoflavimicrobium dichotomicum]